MIEQRSAPSVVPPSTTFGELLRHLRRRARLTQRALAIAVGYSPEHICRLEHNRRVPDRATLQALFVPALHLEHEPEVAERLVYLAGLRQKKPTPYASPAPPPHTSPLASLPVPLTPLVGRTHELAAIARLLTQPACRVLTLTGMGGSGKTRVAIAAASEHGAHFADGAVFVPLAPLHAPELVAPALMNALAVPRSGHAAPAAQLQAYLQPKHLLLILDNAEHLLDGMHVLEDLLQHAPLVKLLITSRERLHLHGEWIIEIGGLAVPPITSTHAAMDGSAVQLFVQCACRVRADFALTDDELPAIIRICRTVAGLPLGVELAAQWLRVLSCAEIADELERNLDLLTSAAREVPQRHRSLRAVFEHSWSLLGSDAQRVLRRISVFQGGFDRAAALQVAGAGLPLLRVLLDHALLVRAAADRYDLHPLVQQYAHEQLARAAEYADVRDRHAAWCRALADQAAPHLHAGAQRAWLERLETEHDNLRGALRWLRERGAAAEMAHLSTALIDFWRMRGYFSEGRHWLEAVLAHGRALAPAQRAAVLGALGELAWNQGDYEYAQTVLEESLALHRAHDDVGHVAAVLHRLGAIAGYQGQYDRATTLYGESLVLRRALGDDVGVAATLNNLAITAQEQGDEQHAQDLLGESLHLFRCHDDIHGTAIALNNLGDLALRCGDMARAAALLRESLLLRRTLGDQHGIALGLRGLADVAAAEQRPELAARLWGASERLCDVYGVGVPPSDRERYDRTLATARAHLGEQIFAAAWQAGRALDVEQALAEASAVGAPAQQRAESEHTNAGSPC